ncbi:MAG: DUF58 domain-containing protein [Magnetococcales bacterium]|nr:DUF58 domain-containing protein [Magnetococcales bacterium]
MDDGARMGLEDLVRLRHQAAALALPGSVRTANPWAGPFRSLFRGRGMEFEETRLYQPGDDIRSMDWQVTARTGKPHSKVFREERERPVFLVVDLNPGMAFGTKVAFKSVVAVRLAGLLGWVAALAGDRIGGVVLGAAGPLLCRPAGGQRGLLPLLRALASRQPVPGGNGPSSPWLADGLARLRRVARPGSLMILLSDFTSLDATAERLLGLLAPHNTLLGVMIHDPLEVTLPAEGIFSFTDGQRILRLETGAATLRARHQQRFRERQAAAERLFGRLAAPLLTLATDQPITGFLRREMQPLLSHRGQR